MSAPSRWIIATFSLFCACCFVYVIFFVPGGVAPRGPVARVGVLLVPLFCLCITISCFPGPLRRIAARFLGGCVFLMSLLYLATELSKPLPVLVKSLNTGTNLPNAIEFFFTAGLPGAYVLWRGRLSVEERAKYSSAPVVKRRKEKKRIGENILLEKGEDPWA